MSSFFTTLSLCCKVGTAEVEFLTNSTGFFLRRPPSATTSFLIISIQGLQKGGREVLMIFRNATLNFGNTGNTCNFFTLSQHGILLT